MNNIVEIIRSLESAVHRHSARIKSFRRRLRGYQQGKVTEDELKNSLGKLIRSSRKLEKVFTLVQDTLSSVHLDTETSERIHLLAFFVYEVAINEELDLWKRVSRIPELAPVAGDIDAHIARLEKLRNLVSSVLAGTKLAD